MRSQKMFRHMIDHWLPAEKKNSETKKQSFVELTLDNQVISVPTKFIDPIRGHIMRVPMLASNGKNYEAKELLKFTTDTNDEIKLTHPQVILNKKLFFNYGLYQEIRDFFIKLEIEKKELPQIAKQYAQPLAMDNKTIGQLLLSSADKHVDIDRVFTKLPATSSENKESPSEQYTSYDLTDVFNIKVPQRFICPNTLCVMRVPALTEEGSCVEALFIAKWLQTHSTSSVLIDFHIAKKIRFDRQLYEEIREFFTALLQEHKSSNEIIKKEISSYAAALTMDEDAVKDLHRICEEGSITLDGFTDDILPKNQIEYFPPLNQAPVLIDQPRRRYHLSWSTIMMNGAVMGTIMPLGAGLIYDDRVFDTHDMINLGVFSVASGAIASAFTGLTVSLLCRRIEIPIPDHICDTLAAFGIPPLLTGVTCTALFATSLPHWMPPVIVAGTAIAARILPHPISSCVSSLWNSVQRCRRRQPEVPDLEAALLPGGPG